MHGVILACTSGVESSLFWFANRTSAAGKQYFHQQHGNKASAPIMTHRSFELSSNPDIIPVSGSPS